MARARFRDQELRKQLGRRIRALRKARKLGTTELAQRVGFADRMSLLRVERADIGGLSLEKLVRLADELGTSTDYLLGRCAALALCLAVLTGCAQAHGRVELPLYVHLCDAMPAADQEAWGASAAALNAEREEAALWVGHGPPVGCSTVDVCPSAAVLADAETHVGACVVTLRYAPGTAREVAAQELDALLGRLP